MTDEARESAVAFTKEALAFFARYGVTVERIMSDNGLAYHSRAFRDLLANAGLRHVRTLHAATNGKAERFIQTSLREWIYAKPWQRQTRRQGLCTSFIARAE